jgi:hypothetical protein
MITTKSVVLFALVYGIAFTIAGLGGFVPGLNQMQAGDPNLHVHGPGHGYLLGLFHVNVLHSLVHVLFGVMGLAMARSWDSARLYARIVAVGYGLLTIMGLVPALNTVFGLIPIHGHDGWLHAAIAAVSAYFGFAGRRDAVADGTTPHAA